MTCDRARNLRPSRAARALPWAAVALVVLAGASAVTSCVIADPQIELPKLPIRRPVILRDQVVPTAAHILGYFPSEFTLAVEVDPSQDVVARLFIDYPEGLSFERATAAFAGEQTVIATGATGVREITLVPNLLPEKPSLDECHVIEAIVAFEFNGRPPNGLDTHTPRAPGGDSVVWFYSPSGDLSSCPHVDGGVDGSFPEVGPPDGGPITPEGGD